MAVSGERENKTGETYRDTTPAMRFAGVLGACTISFSVVIWVVGLVMGHGDSWTRVGPSLTWGAAGFICLVPLAFIGSAARDGRHQWQRIALATAGGGIPVVLLFGWRGPLDGALPLALTFGCQWYNERRFRRGFSAARHPSPATGGRRTRRVKGKGKRRRRS